MELFKLLGTIAINNTDANNAIADTTEKTHSFGEKLSSGIKTVGKWGLAIGGAAVAAGTAITAFATKAASTGDRIDKMSQKIGISRQAFQELDFICSQSGTSVDTLQMGIKTLTNQMQSAAAGTKSAVGIFEQLGVSIYDSNGQLKDQEAMMWEAMSALQAMENQTEKAALATDLFGRSGSELMPLLNGAEGSIEAMKQQAHDLGLVLSDDFVDSSVKFTDTMDQLKRSASAAMLSAFTPLLPTIQSIGAKLVELAPRLQEISSTISDKLSVALKFVAENSGVAKKTFGELWNICKTAWENIGKPVFDGILETIDWMFGNWNTISKKISSAFEVLWDFCKTCWVNIGKPIWEMISSAISMLVTEFAKYMPQIKKFFQEAVSGIKDTWNNHLKPVFEAIGKILNEYVKPAFEVVFKTFVIPIITNAFKMIGQLWKGTLKPVFDGICDFLTGVFTGDWKKAFQGILDVVTGIFNGVINVTNTCIDTMKTVVKNGIEFIKEKFNFDWKLPDLKLPHFKIDGEFSVNPPSVPKFGVEWYKKGAVLNAATIFGVNPATGKAMVGGEAGAEAVAPIDVLQGYVTEAVAGQNAELLAVLSEILKAIETMDDGLLDKLITALVEGVKFKVDNREIGRMVRSYVG